MNTKPTPDSLLIERAQDGDATALDTLIARYQDKAYKYAFRLTRDPEEAADTVANAFVRIYRSIGSFKGQSAFTTWMYRIITNCYLDIKKRASTRPAISLETSIEGEEGNMLEYQFEDQSPGAFEEVLRKEKNKAVEEALADLPDYQKIALVMFHVEMRSYEEIAETLGLPIGTVKSRLNRARCSLSRAMTDSRSLFDEHVEAGEFAAA